MGKIDLSIYFGEKDDKGNSSFKKININKYGVLSEWPKDFFDVTQKISDQIIFESLKKQEEEDNEND
jgi:predicted ATPase